MKRFALLFLLAGPAWSVEVSTISFVQANACHDTPATGATSAACQYTLQVVPGHGQVVDCMGNSLTACLTVTDDQSDVFTLVGGTLTTAAPSGGTLVWGTWYSTGAAGDFTTVTCNDPCSNTAWVEMSIHEYTNLATAFDTFDVASSSSAISLISTTTFTSGYVTTTKNNEMCHSVAPQMTSAALAGNGTIRTNSVDNTYWATQDAPVLLGGTLYQSSFTVTAASLVNKMSQACFKPPTPSPRGVEEWR